MREKIWLFGQSFLLTLLLLLPMIWAVQFFAGQRQQQRALLEAATGQSDVPVAPGAQGTHRLLLAVQGEVPQFFLLRADAPARTLTLCAVPSDTLVRAPAGQTTLADCYMAAGPARAAQLLGQTVGLAPQGYFAATAATWSTFLDGAASYTLDTAPLLTEELRRELDLDGAAADLTAAKTTAFLQAAQAAGANGPALRAAAWAALLGQNPAVLADLAEAARQSGDRTLTDLRAQDLHALEQTLGYLAEDPGLTVTWEELPTLPAAGGRELSAAGVTRAKALLG